LHVELLERASHLHHDALTNNSCDTFMSGVNI